MNENNCISVIGSEGYIGRHLVNILENQYHKTVFCYDILDKSENSLYTKIDLLETKSLREINLDVQCVFLISGITGTYAGFEDYKKYIDINELGLLNILNVIRHSSYTPRIVFPSSRLVYKGQNKPLCETDEKETKTIYAVNKLACENILHAYACSFDIPYSICRICVPYGNILGKDYSFGTIGFFINTALKGLSISLYGGGANKRTFTHIIDVCNQMIFAGLNIIEKEIIFNVGGETYSLYQVASKIALKYNISVTNVNWPSKDFKIESGDTFFDDSKIISYMGKYTYTKLDEFIENLND